MVKLVLLWVILFNWTSSVLASEMSASDFDLNDYHGTPVYLDFWASWCIPCKASFPWMNAMQQKYAGKIHFIGVNLDVDKADSEAFLDKVPANFPIVYDPEASLAERFEIVGMPTAILFDTIGRVEGRHIGFRKSKQEVYEQAIRNILEQQEDETVRK